MVALVRAGVTATCSGADKPRYGNLDVDSNLPDTRIALGGPTRNAFTKAVLDEADPEYTHELERQLAKTGRARVWVPAAKPLAAVWVPGADLRSVRALPVLVIDGRDERRLAAAVASVADDLADAEIEVGQDVRQAPPGTEAFEARTVALFNRGVPSFAVDTEGTLHTALMRSCTGWPSGVWIDEPRRTAPDGSNFQLQHWTHDFDYALVCDDGDWRQAGIPARSAQFSHPLTAVIPQRRGATLPPIGSLLHVETGRLGAPRRPQGRGKPDGERQPPAGRTRDGGAAVGGDERHRHPRRRRLRARQGARAPARRSAGKPPRSQTIDRPARPTGRHGAGPNRRGQGHAAAARGHCRTGPAGRDRPAAVRAVLAAQPRPRAIGRAAGRRPPAPPAGDGRTGRRGGVASHRGQRLLRFAAARHRGSGVPGWLVGQTGRTAVHAVFRRASGDRRGAGGSAPHGAGPVPGARAAQPGREGRAGRLATGGRGRVRGGRR